MPASTSGKPVRPCCQAVNRSAARFVRIGLVGRHGLELRPDRLADRVGTVEQDVGEEVPPGDLPGQGGRPLGPPGSKVGQHRTWVQVPPAQRDGQVGGGVRAGKVVQVGVVLHPAGVSVQPSLPGPPSRPLAGEGHQVGVGLLEPRLTNGGQPVDRTGAYPGCRSVHAVLGPGAMEGAEHLVRAAGAVRQSSRRHRVGRTGPAEVDLRTGECRRHGFVPRSTVRGEVGADMHLTGATGPGHLQHGIARLAAYDAEARTSRLAQFGVEGMQRGEQPGPADGTCRAQQHRVEDEKRQHGLAFVNRRPQRWIVGEPEVTSQPPDRGTHVGCHRLILPRASDREAPVGEHPAGQGE